MSCGGRDSWNDSGVEVVLNLGVGETGSGGTDYSARPSQLQPMACWEISQASLLCAEGCVSATSAGG